MPTYNGWKSYETWLVNLWIDNDEAAQAYWQDVVEEVCKDSDGDYDEMVRMLADRLHYEIEAASDEITDCSGLFRDLLNSALSEVFWWEIAENMLDDIAYETADAEAEE